MIRFIHDTATTSLALERATPGPHGAVIEIGLARHARTVAFQGLRVTIEVWRDGVPTVQHRFPPPGAECRETDQDLLTALVVAWRPDETVAIAVTLDNDGQRSEARCDFTAPRPAQPYPSWLWTGQAWAPPLPYPDDGAWDWDETRALWVPAP